MKYLKEQNRLLKEEIQYLKNALCKCPNMETYCNCPIHGWNINYYLPRTTPSTTEVAKKNNSKAVKTKRKVGNK